MQKDYIQDIVFLFHMGWTEICKTYVLLVQRIEGSYAHDSISPGHRNLLSLAPPIGQDSVCCFILFYQQTRMCLRMVTDRHRVPSISLIEARREHNRPIKCESSFQQFLKSYHSVLKLDSSPVRQPLSSWWRACSTTVLYAEEVTLFQNGLFSLVPVNPLPSSTCPTISPYIPPVKQSSSCLSQFLP